MKTSRRLGLSASPLRAGRAAAALLVLGLLAACAGSPPPSPMAQAYQPPTVVVERGDTLSGIARARGVTLQAIAAANGLAPPYRIHPGQVLHVPGTLPPPVPIAPPVQSGTQVASIAPLPPPASAPAVEQATLPASPARAVTVEALPSPGPPSPIQQVAPIQQAAPVQQVAPVQQATLPSPPSPPPAVQAAVTERAALEPAPRAAAAPPPRRMPPGRFAWPVRGQVVSAFGSKGGGLVNDGMNIAAPRGTPVRAAADGTVIYAGNEVRGFGNLVLIRHEGGWVTAYGHADRVLVRQGQAVRTGEEIARVGSSGAVTTPQLHFQVRRDGKPVDPAAHLERAVANRGA
jgi:murein DD-endopeptidase MepM/ murein hydrolase activator NlpD